MVALNGDVVSYSRLMAEDHEATRSIVESLQHLVTERVSEKRGPLVHFVRDKLRAGTGEFPPQKGWDFVWGSIRGR